MNVRPSHEHPLACGRTVVLCQMVGEVSPLLFYVVVSSTLGDLVVWS